MTNFKSTLQSLFLISLGCVSSTMLGTPIALDKTTELPLFGSHSDFFLNENYYIENVDGFDFDTAFIGSSNYFYLNGSKKDLVFYKCQDPALADTGLLRSATLLILNNLNTLSIQECTSPNSAMIKGEDIVISNTNNLMFANNIVLYRPASQPSTDGTSTIVELKGSVISGYRQVIIAQINNSLSFKNNAGNFGPAVLTPLADSSITFNNNTANIQFLNNTAFCGGGSIYGSLITFSNNSGAILFHQNTAQNIVGQPTPPVDTTLALGCGGAINSPISSVQFINNAQTTFTRNEAANDGGAIHADNIYIFNTPLNMSFNVALGYGGAISGNDISLNPLGETVFLENRAISGGAIYLKNALAKLSIAAENGQVVFSKNIATNTSATTPVELRNSIHLTYEASITSLQAKNPYKIIFYDPITHDDTPVGSTAPIVSNLDINKDGFQGTILFSGMDLDETEALIADNYTSTIRQSVVLHDGSLLLRKAILNTLGFEQLGGNVILSSGSQLGIVSENAGTVSPTASLSLNNVSVEAPIVFNPDYVAPIIRADTNATVELSGNLSLYRNNIFHENPNLELPQEIDFLSIVGAGTVDISNFLLTADNFNNTYGYQGNWTIDLDTAVAGTTTIKGIWTPTSTPNYLINPELKGDIIVNSMRSMMLNTETIAKTTVKDKHRHNKNALILSLEGILSSSRQFINNDYDGFKSTNKGYNLSLDLYAPNKLTLTLGFGQVNSILNSSLYEFEDNIKTLIGTFGLKRTLYDSKTQWILSGLTALGHSSHELTSIYRSYKPNLSSEGNWDSHESFTKLSIERNLSRSTGIIQEKTGLSSISQFVSLEFAYGKHNAFKEQSGLLSRDFIRGEGYSLSLPVGFSASARTKILRTFSHLLFSTAYKAEVYRKSPLTRFYLPLNSLKWSTQALNLSRHSFYTGIQSTTYLTKNISISCDYDLNFRSNLLSQTGFIRLSCSL